MPLNGHVYFEMAIPSGLTDETKITNLSDEAKKVADTIDPPGPGCARAKWLNRKDLPDKVADTPRYLETVIIPMLKDPYNKLKVVRENPPIYTYCYTDTTRTCYHGFRMQREDGSIVRVQKDELEVDLILMAAALDGKYGPYYLLNELVEELVG